VSSTKNLAFLSSAIRSAGHTQKSFSEGLDITAQGVSYMFNADDALLSLVEKGLAGINRKLTISFTPLPQKKTADIINNADLFRLSEASYEEPVRLAPIAQLLRSANMELTEIENLAGVSYYMIHKDFKRDDMRISRIYKIANALGVRPIWTIDVLEQNPAVQAPIISEQKSQIEVPDVLPIRKTSFILREDYYMNLKMLAAKKRTTVSNLVNESLSLLFQINKDLLK